MNNNMIRLNIKAKQGYKISAYLLNTGYNMGFCFVGSKNKPITEYKPIRYMRILRRLTA